MYSSGVGGYFELELKKGKEFHSKAIALNSARNCLEYVLRSRKYTKIYIPYYTCEVILEPLNKCNVQYEFYEIDKSLNPVKYYNLEKGEAFLYTNYFGLKQDTVKSLANFYGNRLIVDNAQAFFAEPIEGIDTFYSARKFFGVPDGAYLYTNSILNDDFEQDKSYARMLHLLKRADIDSSFGFSDYHINEDSLKNQRIKKMSNITHAILASVDYEYVISTRRDNYRFLNDKLMYSNKLDLILDEESVPMAYPYYSDEQKLRSELIKNKIFVATYWPNVMDWTNNNSLEYNLCKNILPLPIDQRYGLDECNKILKILK